MENLFTSSEWRRPVAIRFWFLKLLIIKSELRPANRHSNRSEEFAHNNFLSFKSLVVQDRDFTREVRRSFFFCFSTIAFILILPLKEILSSVSFFLEYCYYQPKVRKGHVCWEVCGQLWVLSGNGLGS